jgi:hypothetical protein
MANDDLITEPPPARKTADQLAEKVEENRRRLEEVRQERKEAEKRHQEATTEAVEAEALAGVSGVDGAPDPSAAAAAAESAADELEELKETEATLETRIELLEARRKEAEMEALKAEAQLLREHVGREAERMADILNEAAEQMEALREANRAWAEARARMPDRGPYHSTVDLTMGELRPHSGGERHGHGKTALVAWFERAKGAGFDVELEHGFWADQV